MPTLPLVQQYVHFWHQHIDLSIAGISLDFSIVHWINDGLMTIFFLLIGLEIEREMYIGELSDIRNAILPILAAIGGMLLPGLIHYAFNAGTSTQAGFGIPMATDIAFALGILSLAGNKIPITIKIFLTALAIIDDLGAIVIIAIFYTHDLSFYYLITALTHFWHFVVNESISSKPIGILPDSGCDHVVLYASVWGTCHHRRCIAGLCHSF